MKQSAGILVYRQRNNQLEFFLVHPGGPFWSKKDLGTWTIPKGEIGDDEQPLLAARREFEEETGASINGEFRELKPVKLKSGKLVMAWAVEGDLDAETISSNTFSLEWPPRSGKQKTFPEVDKAGWFALEVAVEKINAAQTAFLEEVHAGIQK